MTKNQEEFRSYIMELSNRKPVKKFKSEKGYDRVRDRKDKRLYEEDLEENESATEQISQSIF